MLLICFRSYRELRFTKLPEPSTERPQPSVGDMTLEIDALSGADAGRWGMTGKVPEFFRIQGLYLPWISHTSSFYSLQRSQALRWVIAADFTRHGPRDQSPMQHHVQASHS